MIKVYRDIFTGLYYSHLLSKDFSNVYGQGITRDSAISSIKIRINQLKNKL